MSYKPEYILLNFSTGRLVGCGPEDECRTQLKKVNDGSSAGEADTYILAEVKVLSEMKRVET